MKNSPVHACGLAKRVEFASFQSEEFVATLGCSASTWRSICGRHPPGIFSGQSDMAANVRKRERSPGRDGLIGSAHSFWKQSSTATNSVSHREKPRKMKIDRARCSLGLVAISVSSGGRKGSSYFFLSSFFSSLAGPTDTTSTLPIFFNFLTTTRVSISPTVVTF